MDEEHKRLCQLLLIEHGLDAVDVVVKVLQLGLGKQEYQAFWQTAWSTCPFVDEKDKEF